MRVLLVSMPFGAIDRPALGISLLKSALTTSGIACGIRHLNCDFAESIGIDAYDWITNQLPYTAFVGDWCFTPSLYGPRPAEDRCYIDAVLRGLWQFDDATISNLIAVKDRTPAFIETCCAVHDWESFDAIGFTSTFTQNIASLALAKKLKERLPKLKIVFGGANWEGEMGEELHRLFPFVDFVCQGEADESFPALIEHLREARGEAPAAPGIVFRTRDGNTAITTPARPVTNINALPIPDFADYFKRVRQSFGSCVYQSIASHGNVPGLLVGGQVPLHLLRVERQRHAISQQGSHACA